MGIGLGATFTLKVWQPSEGCPPYDHPPCRHCCQRDERKAHNLMTTQGLAAVANSFNYSAAFAQNTALGGPFSVNNQLSVTPGSNDVYGAVGTGTVTPTSSDTQLSIEIARLVMSNANASLSTATFDFFFGIGVAAGVLGEIGVFCNANNTVNNGTLLDHALLVPTVTVGVAQTVTLEGIFSFTGG